MFVAYVFVLVLGLRHSDLRDFVHKQNALKWSAWSAPEVDTIPDSPQGDAIRRGQRIFISTPAYAARYTGNQLSCGDCHLAGGTAPYASPMVGLPAKFPMYNKRAGHVITLKDRIQECFTRSENGTPLPYDGTEMDDLVAYINWLSRPHLDERNFIGRGLIELPNENPNAKHGEQVYATQCAGCHGENGEGRRPMMPPLWGPGSFNDGAGMNGIRKMAAFVQYNMPQNRNGILSPQDAYDVAAFIHTKPRPAFNPAYSHY